MFAAGISSSTLHKLRRVARRWAWTREDADDLVQDALLAALEQKLEQPLDGDERRFQAWASGVIRNRAMFLARTAARRRRRETNHVIDTAAPATSLVRLPSPFVDALPRSLQTVALLANAGLGRLEIAHLLGISDAALRKRISDLRKAWREARDEAEVSPPRRHRPPCGVLRRSLRSELLTLPAAHFAVADPDGHKIFLAVAHKIPPRGNRNTCSQN